MSRPAATDPQFLSALDEHIHTLTAAPLLKSKHDAVCEVSNIVESILCIYERLASLQELKPGLEVNALFNRLVALCIKPYPLTLASQVLANKRIQLVTPWLRKLCSQGEGELERFWARKMLLDSAQPSCGAIAGGDRERILRQFPYYDNYQDLCSLELSMILAVLPPMQRSHPISIAFIGSGPLPLTSFFFADSLPSAHIHNIDNDVTAIAISSVLAKQCAYHPRMTFGTNDATSCGSLQRFDVVCIAALVGMDMDAKKEVLKAVSARMRNDALICVRSAVALRGLLYPVIEFDEDLRALGLEMVVEVRPWNHIVNSTLVMKVVRKEEDY